MPSLRHVGPRYLLGFVALAAVGLGTFVTFAGCSSGADEPYKPAPAWSGRKPSLPAVPPLPTTPIRQADAYTVYGAIHHLKSMLHNPEVTSKEITIVGYIVETNIADFPKCALHRRGTADKEGCESPLPMFTIADTKGDTKGDKIKVLGWAKNPATVYDAMDAYRGRKDPPAKLLKEDAWDVEVPFPLPAVGAKVKVTGKYGYTFTESPTGIVSDPNHGVVTFKKMDELEAAPQPASFAK
jgi:hypothetical protein